MITGYRFTVFASDLARSSDFYENRLGCVLSDVTELGFTATRDQLVVTVEGGAKQRKLGKSMHHRRRLTATSHSQHGQMRVARSLHDGALLLREFHRALARCTRCLACTHWSPPAARRCACRKSSSIAHAASASRNAFFSPCVRPVRLSFSSAAKLDSLSS